MVIRNPLVLFLFFMAVQMGCAVHQPDALRGLPWTGKFPVFVVAHRGFSGVAPENTVASFKRAIEAGSDMIEADVHLSKDGEVIVIHDDTLNRTTNGKGKVVQFTLKELKALDAGSWVGPQFSGEKIPTLREVLGLARGQVLMNVELKYGDMAPYTMMDLADRSLEEVEKMGVVDQVLFSSFDPSSLERIRQKKPDLPCAIIYNKPWNSPQEVTGGKRFFSLNCRKSVLTRVNISEAHREGFNVFVWTVNTEEEMEQFLDLGVNGIVTDYPDKLIQILQKRYH